MMKKLHSAFLKGKGKKLQILEIAFKSLEFTHSSKIKSFGVENKLRGAKRKKLQLAVEVNYTKAPFLCILFLCCDDPQNIH